MVHRRERLTAKERIAHALYADQLSITKRLTDKAVIIAMVGLVGSGKSAVARDLARHIGGVVIEADAIRIELRKQGEKYENARLIAEMVAFRVLHSGGNAVLDSDFIDANKRASIREKARKASVRLVFVRTHCDPDVAMGRILDAKYEDSANDFFGGASSKWKGSHKGAIVKWREMMRRLPQHYHWVNEAGGRWELKQLSFKLADDIDTTDEGLWKTRVQMVADELQLL